MKWFLIFAISVIMNAEQLYAYEHNNASEESIQHYQADKPKTTKEALLILTSKTAIIEKTLLNEKLSANDFEEIHEISYWLEAAVDYLRKIKLGNDQEIALDKLDEAVQALHYSSENHQEVETREWFVQLNSAIIGVNDIF